MIWVPDGYPDAYRKHPYPTGPSHYAVYDPAEEKFYAVTPTEVTRWKRYNRLIYEVRELILMNYPSTDFANKLAKYEGLISGLVSEISTASEANPDYDGLLDRIISRDATHRLDTIFPKLESLQNADVDYLKKNYKFDGAPRRTTVEHRRGSALLDTWTLPGAVIFLPVKWQDSE